MADVNRYKNANYKRLSNWLKSDEGKAKFIEDQKQSEKFEKKLLKNNPDLKIRFDI